MSRKKCREAHIIAEFWSVCCMNDLIRCFVFTCRGKIGDEDCRMPIMLPVGAFERQFPNRAAQPNDVFPVALLCWRCKRLDIYTPQQNSPYFDPGWQSKECFPNGDTEFLLPLQCEGGNCEFRAPLFVTWNADTTVEEKERAMKTWKGGHLRAPDGHRIHWPVDYF